MAKLKELKASTIIEAIMALLIITLITGISLMLLGKNSGSNRNILHYKAMSEVQKIYYNSFDDKDFNSKSIEKEGLRIELSFKENISWKNVLIADCLVFDINNTIIYERHWLIPAS